MAEENRGRKARAVGLGGTETAILPPHDICLSTKKALMIAISREIKNLKGADWTCIDQLLDICLQEGEISPDNARALAISLSRCNATNATVAEKRCAANLILLLRLSDAGELRHFLQMQNCIENAGVSTAALQAGAKECADSLAFGQLWGNLGKAIDEVSHRIKTALEVAGKLYERLLSSDCGADLRRYVGEMSEAFRAVESGCCVLLCEFDQAWIVEDACYVALETRLLEVMQYIALAGPMLEKINVAPQNTESGLEKTKRWLADALEKRGLSEQTRKDMTKLQSDLERLPLHAPGVASQALMNDVLGSLGRLLCNPEIPRRNFLRITGELFTWKCRASQSVTSLSPTVDSGLALTFPPEVAKVSLQDLPHGPTIDMVPIAGQLQVLRDPGQRVAVWAYDTEGGLVDHEVVEADY